MLYDEHMNPGAIPLSVLSKITNNFSEGQKIGSGSFGEVYKGKVENDFVAVKKIIQLSMDEKEYKRELECLLKVKHKNIVRFLGYCGDTQWDMRKIKKKKKAKKEEIVQSNKEERLLCFEYVPHGALDAYIKDPSTGLAWRNRFRIIKGICEGLSYLHQPDIDIVHLDLKPGNILLGENEVPIITDFGLSRCFREGKTDVTATKVVGTPGYMAPEYYNTEKITKKFDLYSLGVLILEIITGKKGHQDVHEVHKSWYNRLDSDISQRNVEWEQIQVCTEIGIQCMESDPAKRPGSMKEIMDKLDKIEKLHVIPAAGGQSMLLDVQPPVLYFPFESNKAIPCSLHLTNNTNEQVAFRLMDRSSDSGPSFVRLPVCGLVPPGSTYNLVLTTEERNKLEKRNICMILKMTILGDGHIDKFQSDDAFFEDVKEKGNEVQEVKLIGVHTTTRQEIMPSEQMPPKIKILDIGKWFNQSLGDKCYDMRSWDINHARQWIITGGSQGHVGIWNYQTQRMVDSLRLFMYEDVICVKFIAPKQCFAAMTERGVVHVYNYEPKIRKVTSMSAAYVDASSRMNRKFCFLSLAVHPIKPYLLTLSGVELKLWDGDKCWECIQIFRVLGYRRGPYPVAFNLMADTIAIASDGDKVEIRSLAGSPKKEDYKMLSGHSDEVNSLHFFTSGDQEYLVTGSDDKTAKIWDMETRICLYTLESLGSPVISVVAYQPDLQILMTGSNDGLICLWSTDNSRESAEMICSRSPSLQSIIDLRYGGSPRFHRIVDVRYGGALHGLACSIERVMIENNQEEEEPTQYPLGLRGDTTFEVLDVHPLELVFHPIPHNVRPLYLTNKTDEHVVFRVAKLVDHLDSDSWDYLPLYGTVHPRSTCRLIVITDQVNEIDTEMDIVVQSSILGDKNLVLLARPSECHEFFDQAKAQGQAVHEVPLKFVYTPTVPEPAIAPIVTTAHWYNRGSCRLHCLDAHPTEPWIITGHLNGDAWMWNCGTQGLVQTPFKISEETVMSVKFDARRHWIVAQTRDGLIHLYDCACGTQIKKIASFGDVDSKPIQYSIAINPIKPYVLSSSKSAMELWNGDKGWECTQTFGSKSKCTSFDPDEPPMSKCQAFNPEDPNSFANLSVSEIVEPGSLRDPMVDVQVWSLDSSEPNYHLSGHSETVNCLAYFTRADGQYLITGSDDCTAKIWDLQKKACIHTLVGFMSPVLHVISIPDRPYLVTCSKHGTIHVWSSIDFRLKTTVDFSSGERVRALACLMGSRIAIGRRFSISVMDIDHEEEAVASKGNNEDSICVMGQSST